jgi:hypothetical protein
MPPFCTGDEFPSRHGRSHASLPGAFRVSETVGLESASENDGALSGVRRRGARPRRTRRLGPGRRRGSRTRRRHPSRPRRLRGSFPPTPNRRDRPSRPRPTRRRRRLPPRRPRRPGAAARSAGEGTRRSPRPTHRKSTTRRSNRSRKHKIQIAPDTKRRDGGGRRGMPRRCRRGRWRARTPTRPRRSRARRNTRIRRRRTDIGGSPCRRPRP